jgi:signal recognition particle subunit SRP54
MGLLPGMGKMKNAVESANLDDKVIKRQVAIIRSMTPYERSHPKALDGKRKRRIAAGSGTRVEDVNRLVKMHRQMADMMKSLGKNKGLMSKLFGGGGAMPEPSPEMLEQLKKGMPPGGGLPGMPGLPPGQLPGLGGMRLPGLPGLPGKKK